MTTSFRHHAETGGEELQPFEMPSMRHVPESGNIILLGQLRLTMPLGLPDYIVPAEFESDGQSSPRGLWWITGPPIRSKYLASWVGHDHACKTAKTLFERAYADVLLGFWLICQAASFVKASGTFWACFTYGRIKFLRRNGWS